MLKAAIGFTNGLSSLSRKERVKIYKSFLMHQYQCNSRGILKNQIIAAVIWLKCCLYSVQQKHIYQSITKLLITYLGRRLFTYSYSFFVVFFVFVFLGFYVPHENVSLWRCRHYRWRTTSCDLHSTLMAIEHWGFFSMPHLLRHGASVYNGYLRGPVTLTPVAECLAMELTCLFLRLRSLAAEIRAPNLPHGKRTLQPTAPLRQCLDRGQMGKIEFFSPCSKAISGNFRHRWWHHPYE